MKKSLRKINSDQILNVLTMPMLIIDASKSSQKIGFELVKNSIITHQATIGYPLNSVQLVVQY